MSDEKHGTELLATEEPVVASGLVSRRLRDERDEGLGRKILTREDKERAPALGPRVHVLTS